MNIVAPSVLSMDFSDTKKSIEQLNNSNAKWIHFDVMDGVFVNNISFGTDILKGIKKSSNLIMDVHVMIQNPFKYAKDFIDAGANYYTFHYEAMENDEKIIELANYVKEKNTKVGLSIKPDTDVNKIEHLIKYFDLILVMSVQPGFGGQKFDERAVLKIKQIKNIINQLSMDILIEVDGGINYENGKICREVGCDVLVAGSYIFKNDINEMVDSLL